MFDLKKGIIVGLVAVLLSMAPSAWAASFVSGNLSVNVTVSDLGAVDLTGFDLIISYDDSALDFSGYTLTDELGSIEDGEAEDNSYPAGVDFTPGTISISLESLLEDSDLTGQSDDFVLTTLYFWGDSSTDLESSVSVSAIDISMANIDFSQSIGFSISLAQADAVPVPATLLLLGTGLLGLTGVSRRKK